MPNATRYYRRRYNYRHPTPRRARDECFKRSNDTCQGCGGENATEAHHWTYPPEEKTTADHLTGFCTSCHDIITWFSWFVSCGGSREFLCELFPVFLAWVLDRRDPPETRRVGRARRVHHAWGAVVSGVSRPRTGEVVAILPALLAPVAQLRGPRGRRRPAGLLAGPHPPAARPRRGAADLRHRPSRGGMTRAKWGLPVTSRRPFPGRRTLGRPGREPRLNRRRGRVHRIGYGAGGMPPAMNGTTAL